MLFDMKSPFQLVCSSLEVKEFYSMEITSPNIFVDFLLDFAGNVVFKNEQEDHGSKKKNSIEYRNSSISNFALNSCDNK